MVGRILFTLLMTLFGAWIHHFFNEDVVGGVYVSLIGVGFGLLLLFAVAGMIYAFKGTLDVFDDSVDRAFWFQEKTTWYPLACLIVLAGMAMVSTWNMMDEQRPFILQTWTVKYHGERERDFREILVRSRGPASRERILVLERSGTQATYSYTPYQPPRSFEHLKSGEAVQVRFQMGPLGFFRIYRIDAPEGHSQAGAVP